MIETASACYKNMPNDVTFATSFGVFSFYNEEKRRDHYVGWMSGKTPYAYDHRKNLPQCGSEIELFSIDTQVSCETCGFVAYNDTLSCVQWCQYAKKCVGEEMYNQMMEIAAQQKARK